MRRRNIDVTAETILATDDEIRNAKTQLQLLREQVNVYSKRIGQSKNSQAEDDIVALMQSVESLKHSIQSIENNLKQNESVLHGYLMTIPNVLADEVPDGNSDADNVCIRIVGEARNFSFTPKQHFDLGENLAMLDFQQTAKISGSRFVTLKSHLAKLERAMANFMLDIHTKEFGYTEMSTPLLVRENTMLGIGQLPKFAEDSFIVNGGDYRLIPTSEVTLASMVADMIVSENELPMRFTAWTQCFRSEAGSAGRDTRGMIRLHQFSKVELVSITTPEASATEHERMLNAAETILKKLELPYRVVVLCSGDTGFCATKTYDIEVWLPGQNTYREISSCSNCIAFQARRMKARYKKSLTNTNEFVHTLNGSGLPIGRTMVAIMENYQAADGSIIIPDVLVPYMDGLKSIVA